MTGIPLVEASISTLAAALAAGETTAVELVQGYVDRIATYDREPSSDGARPALNAVVVDNPAALDEQKSVALIEILDALDEIAGGQR
jgi:amidase